MPLVVQHASTTATYTTGTTGTAAPAFGSNTTAGNCLFACITTLTINDGQSITSVTTNGTAENWASAVAISNTQDLPVAIWANPQTGGGQKTVDISWSFNATATTSNSMVLLVDIYEFSGISGATVAAITDQTSTDFDNAGETSWTSLATGTTNEPVELVLGVAGFLVTVVNTTSSVTGPSSPWTNETLLSSSQQAGGTGTGHQFDVYQVSGYQVTSSTGAFTYSGINSESAENGVVVATFLGAKPAVFPGRGLIRARLPRHQFFPRGRAGSNKGGPAAPPPTLGPKLHPFTQAVRARLPRHQFFPKGRTSSNKGTPPKNPTSGAAFRQLTHPVSAPKPRTFSKGRTHSTPPYVKPPPSANPMAIGLTLTAGGLNAWQYIGPVPLTYLQYMQAPGETLQVTFGGASAPAPASFAAIPGLAWPGLMTPGDPVSPPPPPVPPPASVIFTELGPASGYPWYLPTPPPDGRWVIIGGGGQVYDFLHGPERAAEPAVDDLEWDPPGHLAHLPAPFALIAERIRRRQQRKGGPRP